MILTELNEEQLVEKPAERTFQELGYQTIYGPSIHPNLEASERDSLYEILLKDRLFKKLTHLNPNLPQDVYYIAIKQIEGLSEPFRKAPMWMPDRSAHGFAFREFGSHREAEAYPGRRH